MLPFAKIDHFGYRIAYHQGEGSSLLNGRHGPPPWSSGLRQPAAALGRREAVQEVVASLAFLSTDSPQNCFSENES